MSKNVKILVGLAFIVAAILVFLYFHFRKAMVYAKVDMPFTSDGTAILKGTRLGEVEKIEGSADNMQVLIKDNKYSILKSQWYVALEDVEIRKELA